MAPVADLAGEEATVEDVLETSAIAQEAAMIDEDTAREEEKAEEMRST